MIKREHFLKLNVEQKVTVINALLRSGETLTSIANKFGMARSSLQAPFTTAGFKFNKKEKQYVFDNDLMTNPLTATEILTKLDKIEKLIKQFMITDKDIPYKEINEIIAKIPVGKEIRTTIRINKDIWEKFEKFCKNAPNYYKKDLLGIALLEFIKNYNT